MIGPQAAKDGRVELALKTRGEQEQAVDNFAHAKAEEALTKRASAQQAQC
jgi:hypothetical protein